MSLLLVAVFAGIQATAPVVATPASAPTEIESAADTWDMDNDTCGRHSATIGNGIETDDIDYHVVNLQSDAPLSRIEVLRGASGGSTGDCDDSASAPLGWMAEVLLDGTVVFTAQTPDDMIERGATRYGFTVHRRHGSDCCIRHHAYGPGIAIRDDDDNRDDCSCNNVAVTPASWSQAKILYK